MTLGSTTIKWKERSDNLGLSVVLDVEVLYREKSDFQTIEILNHDRFGRLLCLDGYIQACQADEFIYHEMAVHVPLLGKKHSDTSVLIVGGGDGGILREVLVHDFVKSVTMVEIDQKVIEVSNKFLGIQGNYNDPRVSLVIQDASEFVWEAKKSNLLYDVIILDLTEPVGPSASVFTLEFVENISKLITPTGIIIDSDSIFVADGHGYFLQEESSDGENLFSVIKKTKILPNIEIFRTHIPFFPGADFMFFLYGFGETTYKKPFSNYVGRHYNPAIHKAAFVLPAWQQNWLY